MQQLRFFTDYDRRPLIQSKIHNAVSRSQKINAKNSTTGIMASAIIAKTVST